MSVAKMASKSNQYGADGTINGIPVRKVFVSPFRPHMHAQIKRYFQRFGEVESFSVTSKTRQSSFGFVQYKSSDVAVKVLSKSSHHIGVHSFSVKAAYVKFQPDYLAIRPPKQDSPRHILNALNDDCLEVIFRKLKLVDLSAAAGVCVRFQQRAIDAFKSKYKQSIKIEYGSEFDVDKLVMCLRNFGLSIGSLSICQLTHGFNVIDIFKLINENLTASQDSHSIDQAIPQLTEFQLSGCEWLSNINGHEYQKFITSNPGLQKLSLRNIFQWDGTAIKQSIFQHANLVELELDIYICDFMESIGKEDLKPLHSLRKLVMNINDDYETILLMSKMAKIAVQLEHLSLKHGSIDDSIIDDISKLTKLNVIELEDVEFLTDNHIIELAKKLSHLRTLRLIEIEFGEITTNGVRTMLEHTKTLSHLTLDWAKVISTIDDDDYLSILKTLQDRPEKTKLTIELLRPGGRLQVSDELMLANQNWLWIEEKSLRW